MKARANENGRFVLSHTDVLQTSLRSAQRSLPIYWETLQYTLDLVAFCSKNTRKRRPLVETQALRVPTRVKLS